MSDERINQLEARMTRLEDDFGKVKEGMFGTAHEPGAFEMIRRTNDTVMLVSAKLDSQSKSIESLNGAKQRIAGIAIGAGTFGSVLTWLASWFSTKH